MARKGAVALDKVVINIESGVGNTHKNIDKLATSLEKLRDSIKGGFNGIQKLADGLKDLTKVSNKLPDAVENLKLITKVVKPLNKLSEVTRPAGLIATVNSLEKLPKVFKDINPKSLENVKRVSSELATALSPLAEKLQNIGNGFTALSTLAKTYGVQITKLGNDSSSFGNKISTVYNGLKKMGKSLGVIGTVGVGVTKSLNKAFGSMNSKIKQIGLSLLGTRSIFTLTRKAVSEYMQLDQELTQTTQNLWRALGAQLAPVIEYVLYLFKQVIRVIYSVVKALTGIDLIARANAKAMNGWGKSTEDTLGSLQKFDDLNVADFGKGSGDNQLIELDEIDLSPIQRILDLVRKIKEEMISAFDTGQWSGVGNAIADLLNYSFLKISITDFKKILRKFTKPLTSALNGMIQNLNWSDLGAAIANVYTTIVSTVTDILNDIDFGGLGIGLIEGLLGFDPSTVLEVWLARFQAIHNAINEFVSSINLKWDELKAEAVEVGAQIGNIFNEIVFGINWTDVTKAVIEGINTLIEGALSFVSTFDWSGLGTTLGDIVNTIFATFDFTKLADTISTFLSGLLQTLSSFVSTVDWYKIGESIVKLILDVDWAQLAVDLLQFMEDLWGAMLDAASGVGATLGEWLWSLFGGQTAAEDDARTFGEKISDAITQGSIERTRFDAKHPGPNGIGGTIAWLKGVIKGYFGIHSPSTWARDELGKNISQGFANGLDGMWSKSKKHFVTFVNGVIELINNMITSINNKLKISIGSGLSSVLKALGVKVNSGTYQLFSIPTIPKLETGTNEVPYEGIYHLHPGEAVVPKKYNPALGNGGNEEMSQKMDTLIDIMNNMNWTNVVNIGNKTIYKEQQRYNKMQNDKYGTTVNL